MRSTSDARELSCLGTDAVYLSLTSRPRADNAAPKDCTPEGRQSFELATIRCRRGPACLVRYAASLRAFAMSEMATPSATSSVADLRGSVFARGPSNSITESSSRRSAARPLVVRN